MPSFYIYADPIQHQPQPQPQPRPQPQPNLQHIHQERRPLADITNTIRA